MASDGIVSKTATMGLLTHWAMGPYADIYLGNLNGKEGQRRIQAMVSTHSDNSNQTIEVVANGVAVFH